MVPVFVWLYRAGDQTAALAVFAAAAATDGIDGFLARALKQETRLGGYLDPAADKLLALSALILLVSAGRLSGWLLAIVLLRDFSVATGALLLAVQGIPVPASPSRIGKYSTAILAVVVVLALAEGVAYHGERLVPYVAVLSILAAECVLVSNAQYFHQWLSLMRRRPA